jgi:four helix bundle protein
LSESDFEKLRVFRSAEMLSDRVWSIVRRWDAFEKRTLGSQLVRAADSGGANIAEGAGRGTYRDNRRFVTVARGSLFETKYLLKRADNRGLIMPSDAAALKPVLDMLPRSLNAYRRSIGTGAARHASGSSGSSIN